MTIPKWIGPKISVGNILQIILVSVIAGYFHLRQNIADNTARIDKVDTVQKIEIAHTCETLDGIKKRLEGTGRRSQRSDRLPGRPRATQ